MPTITFTEQNLVGLRMLVRRRIAEVKKTEEELGKVAFDGYIKELTAMLHKLGGSHDDSH